MNWKGGREQQDNNQIVFNLIGEKKLKCTMWLLKHKNNLTDNCCKEMYDHDLLKIRIW